jgi:hypothetical protein
VARDVTPPTPGGPSAAAGVAPLFRHHLATGIPRQPIPAASLYSAILIDRLRTSYVRFLKAESLASALSITANELAWLAANEDLRVGGRGWLQSLVTAGAPDAATGDALTHVLTAVLDFARLKAALSPGDESLLAVLRDPDATLPGGGSTRPALTCSAQTLPAVPSDHDATLPGGGSALLALTRWDQSSLSALLTHFFGDPSTVRLKHLESFRRVYDAYAVVTQCGITAAALIATTTNNPTAKDAANLRSALRARYADADWLTLIKPINDAMRALLRDALVACFSTISRAGRRRAASIRPTGCSNIF